MAAGAVRLAAGPPNYFDLKPAWRSVITAGAVGRMAAPPWLEGIEAMFRTIGDQPSLWESLLPEEALRLPEELARVDALLDDPAFFAPVRATLSPGDRAAVHAGGVLPAADVFEVPLTAGV
jgi:IS5 family transposase